MHSRSVYLAAALLGSTQIGGATVLGSFVWILITGLLVIFLLLPFGQQLLAKQVEQRRKRQKVLLGKATELPHNLSAQLNALKKLLPLFNNQKQLDRTFQRVEELEKKLESLRALFLQRNLPIDGQIKQQRRRITMSESNLPTCSQHLTPNEPHYCSRWSACSSGDLRQVPSDLSHFRRRIDDSIREQRRTREIVEEAQDKLRNLRQHQAQVEASLTSGPSTPRFFPTDYRYSKNKRYYHHRSMSSLDEELTSKVFTTGGDRERIRLDEDTRPSSSGGRLKPTSHERGVSFHPHDFDVTISWPSQPPTDSTPVRASNFTSQNELYASHSYRLMLLEDMLSSCKLQLETSLRANATANSEIHITRERLQKLQDENKTSLDRAAHFESKYKNLLHLIQPRLYDLRNQVRSLQQRLMDVNLDVGKDMEAYRDNFALNIQTLYSLIQRANSGSLRSRVEDLTTKIAFQERQLRESESEVHQYKRQILHLNNKVEQLADTAQSKETTIAILEQDFREEKEKSQKLEEQNDELFRERSSLQEEHQTSIAKIQSLRQKLENAREERDKFASDIRRLTSELSHLRSTSEARIEQLASELNDAALALDVERDGWFKRQDGFRHDFKRQNDSLQERIEALQAELEQERSQTFDYRARIEELQMQAKQSEEHIADLKRRVYTEGSTKIQELERQLASAQQIALKSTGDWKSYESRVKELEAELREYKLQFERERRDKTQAQHDFDAVKNDMERIEQIFKETNSEKQQLLRSVSTFEQENRELKKVCKQLRNEVDIYRKDTDSKYARVLEAKRTKEQEEIKRLKTEIAQMEKTHGQREQNLLQRLNETNANFSLLKEQFDRRMQQERDQTTFVANPPPSSSTALHHPSGSSIHTSSTVVRRVTYQSNSAKLGRPV